MRTILGLSKTSTSLGWVLVDGADVSGDTLDHDAFDVDSDKFTNGNIAELAATARRVRAIATATGYTVDRVRVTGSDHIDAEVLLLQKALKQQGFDDVAVIPPAQAAQAWARGIGRANGHDKIAVCIFERAGASLSVIDTNSGAVQTDTTKSQASPGLSDWLTTVFNRDGRPPDSLLLIGSRCDLYKIAGPLNEGLSIPVVDSLDAQLALARGAALSSARHVGDTPVKRKLGLASHARSVTMAAAIAAITMFALSSAGGPNRLVQADTNQATLPSTTKPIEMPPSAATVLPPAFTPPPRPLPAPAGTVAAVPETFYAPVPQTVPVAPSVQPSPVPHLPEAQPAAPGPPPTETIPPPAPDPIAPVLDPLFESR